MPLADRQTEPKLRVVQEKLLDQIVVLDGQDDQVSADRMRVVAERFGVEEQDIKGAVASKRGRREFVSSKPIIPGESAIQNPDELFRR